MRAIVFLCFALSALAATRTVKTSGGDHATIQECANVMANGDTCVVYAGTYPEHVTMTAGASGSRKTIRTNGTDTVYVLDFTGASYSVLGPGFKIRNPSAPVSADCVLIPASTTDFTITGNDLQQCGSHAAIHVDNAGTASYIYVQGNTISYPCSTPAAPNVCGGMSLHGHHMLVENNDVSHVSDVCTNCAISQFVFRNNVAHDLSSSDCGSNSSNCHIDIIETEPATPTSDILAEGNVGTNNVGSDGHAFLMQGDVCAGQCQRYIVRLNSLAHFGSGGVLDDNAGNSSVNPGFHHVKVYSNTFVDFASYPTNQPFGGTNSHTNNSTYPAELNNIFYYPESLADFNPFVVDASSATGARYGYNLAWCTGATCNLRSHLYNSGTFTSDPGNLKADPLFINYAGNDFRLSSGSPAIGAGTYLTAVAVDDTGSGTTLIVDDAAFFSDGYGLVNADWIRVGASAAAQIASINYATNTITLVSPITRNDGDPVYLYKNSSGTVVFAGTLPDIGAYPYVAPAGNGAPPTKVSVRIVW